MFEAFREFNGALAANLQALMANMPTATPQQCADAVAEINTYYRGLFAVAKLPGGQKGLATCPPDLVAFGVVDCENRLIESGWHHASSGPNSDFSPRTTDSLIVKVWPG